MLVQEHLPDIFANPGPFQPSWRKPNTVDSDQYVARHDEWEYVVAEPGYKRAHIVWILVPDQTRVTLSAVLCMLNREQTDYHQKWPCEADQVVEFCAAFRRTEWTFDCLDQVIAQETVQWEWQQLEELEEKCVWSTKQVLCALKA